MTQACLFLEPGFHSLLSSKELTIGLFIFFLGWGRGVVGSDHGDTKVL